MLTNEQIREVIQRLAGLRSEMITEQMAVKAGSSQWIELEIDIEKIGNALKVLRKRL